MARFTIAFGVFLIAFGIAFFVGTGSQAKTALIPAIAGVLFLLLGALATKESMRKHAMHVAALLALLGAGGSLPRGLPGSLALLRGDHVEKPAAAIEQTLMGLFCIVFLVLCIKSFVAARRARAAAQ